LANDTRLQKSSKVRMNDHPGAMLLATDPADWCNGCQQFPGTFRNQPVVGGPMTEAHYGIGTLTLIAFIVTLALNIRTATTGQYFSWQRGVSFGAATLLLLQYMLGFSLLGEGKSITAVHFLIALAAILPLGMEHGMANTKEDPRERGRLATIANVLTVVVVAIAWYIGDSNT
jgi:hypothetical protein